MVVSVRIRRGPEAQRVTERSPLDSKGLGSVHVEHMRGDKHRRLPNRPDPCLWHWIHRHFTASPE